MTAYYSDRAMRADIGAPSMTTRAKDVTTRIERLRIVRPVILLEHGDDEPTPVAFEARR